MKRTILIAVLWLLCGSLTAKPITLKQAQQVGTAFFMKPTTEKGCLILKNKDQKVSLQLVFPSKEDIHMAIESGATIPFYVFNRKGGGWIMVSGDDRAIPVLAYSDEGSYNTENLPPNMQEWIDGYRHEIEWLLEIDPEQDSIIAAEWKRLLSGKPQKIIPGAKSVSALLNTTWDQAPNYNQLCPYDHSAQERTVTGCVATAMAQILKYWNYPTQGYGSHSYVHPTYGTQSAYFGSTTYEWANMPNRLTNSSSSAQKNAVATLMYHCGVAVNMNYGISSTGGSGAQVLPLYTSDCAMLAYPTYFGYNDSLAGIFRQNNKIYIFDLHQGLDSINYTSTIWSNILKAELDAGRPILYAGFGEGGGHCFVCDGYNNNNYFHFNWGWGGSQDGNFSLSALNPGSGGIGGGSYNFTVNQQAVIGIKPNDALAQNLYDLQMYSSINISATRIPYRSTSTYSISANIANVGTTSFNGQIALALLDEDYNVIDIFAAANVNNLQGNYYTQYSTDFTVNPILIPGTYYLGFVQAPSNNPDGWQFVRYTNNYGNIVAFEIYLSSNTLETNSTFTISSSNGYYLTQSRQETINVDVVNVGSDTFYGDIRLTLSNVNTAAVEQVLYTYNITNGLSPNYHYTNGLNFIGTPNVAPGIYLMDLAYKRNGTSSWYYCGSSDFTNPVLVQVVAPPLQPDQYEVNNTHAQAANLAASFSGNNCTVQTSGANFHIGTDVDYYKIVLQSGYNYIIQPQLFDSYNNDAYTVDAMFSYTVNNENYSDVYDDHSSFPGTITMNDGGTLYIKVIPYFSGEEGTYQMKCLITRTASNPYSSDPYEPNDSHSTAYEFPANFTNNGLTISTAGANFHTGSDMDYYKVSLPQGYRYTINTVLFDANNQPDQYTGDAQISYALNNSNYNAPCESLNTITAENGGNLYFRILRANGTEIGSYMLRVTISRETVGIDDVESDDFLIYPNPTTDVIFIDIEGLQTFDILDLHGRRVATGTSIDLPLHLSGLASGTYIVRATTETCTIVRRIVKQ